VLNVLVVMQIWTQFLSWIYDRDICDGKLACTRRIMITYRQIISPTESVSRILLFHGFALKKLK